MIYNNSIIIPFLIIIQITNTSPDHIIIDIDDEKTEKQEALLKEKRNIKEYIKKQQTLHWAQYEEITTCCCLTTLCISNIAQCMEPFFTIPDAVSLSSALAAGTFLLVIDRYNQPDLSQEHETIRKIDETLKEKFE